MNAVMLSLWTSWSLTILYCNSRWLQTDIFNNKIDIPHCVTYMKNPCPNYIYLHSKSDSDWLRAGRSGDRFPVGARFSSPVQIGPGTHPTSCTMSTLSFSGVESCRSVTLTPHPLIVPRSKKQSRAIPLLSLRAFVACKMCENYLN
jgi:hypothetical protein